MSPHTWWEDPQYKAMREGASYDERVEIIRNESGPSVEEGADHGLEPRPCIVMRYHGKVVSKLQFR